MSKNRYCHNCGKKVGIGFKFCGECGTSLASINSTPETSKPIQDTFTPFVVDGEEDESRDDIKRLDIRISEFDFEIVKHQTPLETIGAAAQGIQPTEEYVRIPEYSNVDPQQFLKEFQKEAGTSRPK